MDERTVVIRLALATLLGGVLGFEREVRGQNAGLRTHMIVALGSCCFTLASIFTEVSLTSGDAPDGARADISRIASQIVVGIGFLGAGVILRHGGTVRGLTTAANLWLTASVGLAAGLGFFTAAGTTVALSLLALVALRPVEKAIGRFRQRHRVTQDKDVAPSQDTPPEDGTRAD